MKICPDCSAANFPDATVCHACGRSLLSAPVQSDPPPAEKTQPRRAQPAADPTDAPYPTPAEPSGGPARPAWERPSAAPPASEISYAQRAQQAYARQAAYPPPDPARAPQPPAYPPGYPPAQPYYSPPPPPAPARRDSTRAWRVISFILLALLACAAIFAVWTAGASLVSGLRRAAAPAPTPLGGLPAAEAQSTATAEPPVTPTPWPTFTPQPTEQPAAPPAEAPQPTPSGPDLTRYLTPECAGALEHLQAANQAFGQNPAAVFDPAWRESLSQAVDQMKAYCATPEEASPVPGQIQEVHRNLDLATQSYDDARRLLQEGAEQFNPGKFIEAGGQLIQAGKYLAQALADLSELGR